ncbi:alkane 1-monooxygenase [Silvimonas amylolytica]|uniref:Alkane 1-monooxygenase n=1 Tax=Silvimonas amylolytica TaxID=449663 RepID=A0ABQ2PLG7_9NEIS|nr:alkane 1-monooxygenase [Silvimonas amylolytica]GGP26464.1 alkane 1-monooxygenase [Silvimonas amylolytica]
MQVQPRACVYMLAWLFPLLSMWGIETGGAATFALPVFAFVLVPVADLFAGRSPRLPNRDGVALADWIMYAYVPLALLALATGVSGASRWTMLEWVGNTLSLGVTAGVGIVVAHELGHRRSTVLRLLSRLMLWTAAYGHYRVEHNRGHHVWVATPYDPATARRNQPYYAFWWQAVSGTLRGAWAQEAARLMKRQLPGWHWRNEVWQNLAATLLLAVFAWLLGRWAGLGLYAAQAVIGFSLLEAVDYIEHYGLMRHRHADGRFERMTAAHSWSANHTVSNWLLFELQRHADHHVRPLLPFSALGDQAESPMLPASYPTMILLALCPPLWYRVMHPRLDRHYEHLATERGVQAV